MCLAGLSSPRRKKKRTTKRSGRERERAGRRPPFGLASILRRLHSIAHTHTCVLIQSKALNRERGGRRYGNCCPASQIPGIASNNNSNSNRDSYAMRCESDEQQIHAVVSTVVQTKALTRVSGGGGRGQYRALTCNAANCSLLDRPISGLYCRI